MLRLRTLGGLAIFQDQNPIAGAGARRLTLALLALAASSSGGIGYEHLLAFLWPEFDSRRARNNLKQVVFASRESFGSVFMRTPVGLRLDPSLISVDLWDFEHALRSGAAEETVVTYGGPFLDGFHVPDHAELERWVETQRARITLQYEEALQRLAIASEVAGDHESAALWWKNLVNQDPLSDRYALNFIRCLAAAGDFVGALRHARAYERRLHEELDVGPGPSLQRLVQEIRQAAASPGGAPFTVSFRRSA
jgi:DNA-binding SARP family transcriptional activator